MDKNKVVIGNATYNVRRQFANSRTIQDTIRESIALHTQRRTARSYIIVPNTAATASSNIGETRHSGH